VLNGRPHKPRIPGVLRKLQADCVFSRGEILDVRAEWEVVKYLNTIVLPSSGQGSARQAPPLLKASAIVYSLIPM
jgi:hypothetical protein